MKSIFGLDCICGRRREQGKAGGIIDQIRVRLVYEMVERDILCSRLKGGE